MRTLRRVATQWQASTRSISTFMCKIAHMSPGQYEHVPTAMHASACPAVTVPCEISGRMHLIGMVHPDIIVMRSCGAEDRIHECGSPLVTAGAGLTDREQKAVLALRSMLRPPFNSLNTKCGIFALTGGYPKCFQMIELEHVNGQEGFDEKGC